MKRRFFHFGYQPQEELIQPEAKTAEDFADEIDKCLKDMMESGQEHGSLVLEIPDDLTEEEALIFIEEIMKRFRDMQEGEDDDE